MPPHRKLEVYGRALESLAHAERITRWIPAARQDLRDQMSRAAASVVLNLAEGSAELSPAEKARFYRIARRSAPECAAAIDIVETIIGSPPEAAAARKSLDDFLAMTTRLVQTHQRRRTR